MGEVRVKVLLTNVADEALARHGYLGKENVRSYEADAMVDTGCVCTVIPAYVMDQLGLLAAEHRQVVQYADGRKEAVDVTEPLRIRINGRTTVEEAVVLGDEVLVGQTVLEKTDLHVDCANQRVVPNPEHPDQPVIKVK
jgi:clan AA aspartic protease